MLVHPPGDFAVHTAELDTSSCECQNYNTIDLIMNLYPVSIAIGYCFQRISRSKDFHGKITNP